MAYAYIDDNNLTQVPVLTGSNNFSGKQTFTANVASTSTSTGTLVVTGGMGVQGSLYAAQVWGCIWNDLADCINVPEDTELEFGRCYCFDGEKYYKSTKYLDDGIIGLHSDTAGFFMGKKNNKKQMQVGVAGFILSYVDKVYPTGTPLTCGTDGILTELKQEDLGKNPHKLVATFWKDELNSTWGPEGKEVEVNGRKWVKVK